MGNRLKTLREKIVELENTITAINEACDSEERGRTEAEAETWRSAEVEIEQLEGDILAAEKLQAKQATRAAEEAKARKTASAVAGDTASRSEDKEIEKIAKRYSMKDFLNVVARGEKPTGLIKEMHEEAMEEKRSFGSAIVGLGIPSRLVDAQKRTDISQGTSAIQPTVIGGYEDGLRENSLAMQVGVQVLNGLTADYKVPYVGANSVAWATGENSGAADGGANFSTLTLNPTRITGYVDISNRILLQNGEAPIQAVMNDLGKATAELIDAAMFGTTSVTNAPVSIPATSGVGTFTEVPTYAAYSSVFKDFLKAEQELADNKALNAGRGVAYVAATNLITDIKLAPRVASVNAGAENAVFAKAMVNGYPCYFHTAVTKNGTTSGDFVFGDWSRVKLGFFGGLDIVKDPYSSLLSDQIRLVLHRHIDFGTGQGAAFIKATSLLS